MKGDAPRPIPPDQTALLFRLFTEIGILNQLATAELTRALGRSLGPSEFSVLTHFMRTDLAATPSYLAKAFQMAKPSMTAIIAKLERKGLVHVRAGAADRRRKFVRITDKGRERHRAALDALTPVLGARLKGFDPDAVGALVPALTALRIHLDAARNHADAITPQESPSDHE